MPAAHTGVTLARSLASIKPKWNAHEVRIRFFYSITSLTERHKTTLWDDVLFWFHKVISWNKLEKHRIHKGLLLRLFFSPAMVGVVHGFFGYLLVNLASVTRVKENEMSNTVMITDISKVAGFSIDMCHCFFWESYDRSGKYICHNCHEHTISILYLGGGFKYVLFSPLPGEMI